MHHKSSLRDGWVALGVEDPLLDEICSQTSSQRSWYQSLGTPENKFFSDTNLPHDRLSSKIILLQDVTKKDIGKLKI